MFFGLQAAQQTPQDQWNQALIKIAYSIAYSSVPGHKNWQIETAGWSWAGFFIVGLETRWQRFEQFLDDLQKQ